MSEHVIKVPDIGEGIAEVELVAWHVKPGDQVTEDQALADVMTDKASVEIPCPVVGRVLALGGEVGQMMAVGSELIRIEVEGVQRAPKGAAKSAASSARAATPAHAPARATAPVPATAPVMPAAPVPSSQASRDRPIASPSVRRRAWELGIDLQQVTPSGKAGRIMQADLDSCLRSHATTLQPMPATAAPPAMGLALREGEEAVPIVGVRRKIAQRMQEAKRRIPHFSYVEEIDVTELEALRAALNARWGAQRPRLTLLPFLMRAMVVALPRFPDINARLDDEAGVLTRHRAVHLGVATHTSAGLMVPVVRHAEARDLWACAAELTRLTELARSGRATRDELTGSTITITSLGALGGIVTTPVINLPEVAIVGVNRIVERPTMRSGSVVPRLTMNLSSSFDHRVIDGIVAAEFVQALRGLLECPATLFID